MPRARSSGRRSASIPVSARRRAVLPWSIWPAVPTTTVGKTSAPAFRALQKRGAQRGGELRVVRGLDGAEVEHDGVVDDAADHDGRARAEPVEQPLGSRPLDGERPGKERLPRERAAAD